MANGIRRFFKDDATVLLDKNQALGSLKQSLLLFDIFVILVGMIALILAFFLLMVST